MRRIGLALMGLAHALVACAPEETRPPPAAPLPTAVVILAPEPAPPPRPRPSLADLQRRALTTALDAMNAHDPKGFANVYAENAVVSVAGSKDVEGRGAIAAQMAGVFENIRGLKIGIARVLVKGDTVLVEWVVNGTLPGAPGGVKAKDRPVGDYGLSILTFDGQGNVEREQRFAQLALQSAKSRPIPPIPTAPENVVSANAASEEKNLAVARSLLTALEANKEAELLAVLTDDVETDGFLDLETTAGKAQARPVFKSFTTTFADARFEGPKAYAVGDYVFVVSTLKATHKGFSSTPKAAGRPVALHRADVVQVRDGRVARLWSYQNGLELQQQLALTPKTPPAKPPTSQ